MKLVEMAPIEITLPRTERQRIRIEGGWHARVAEITIDEATERAYARILGSADAARALHQRVYESGYINGLRLAIARRALEYAKRFPELVEAAPQRYDTSTRYFRLRGFDPMRAQATYIPFDYPGRAGSDIIHDTLEEMARNA